MTQRAAEWLIIGSGRLGTGLAARLVRDGRRVRLAARRLESSALAATRSGAEQVNWSALEQLRPDVLVLAVSDDALRSVAAAMAERLQKAAVALHCSGQANSDCLQPLAEHGWQIGSAHPAVSFADREAVVDRLRGSIWALEGEAPGAPPVRAWLEHIEARRLPLAAEQKSAYHAALVTANNYVAACMDTAWELARRAGLKDEDAHDLLAGLAEQAVSATLRDRGAGNMTGPVARGDVAVLRAEYDDLRAQSPALAARFLALTRVALATADSSGDGVDRQALRRWLQDLRD